MGMEMGDNVLTTCSLAQLCVCPPVALRKPVNVAFVEGVHAPRDRLGYAH